MEKAISCIKNFENLKNIETEIIKSAEKDRGKYLWPLRVALSGKEKSPSPFELIWILGQKESLKRIKKAFEKI